MHITLHLTSNCNIKCDYCYSPPKKAKEMTAEIAEQSINFSSKISPENTGVIFFGGEPLLKKELIKRTIEYCKHRENKFGESYHYKVTTNGLLLNQSFLDYAKDVGLSIAISIDGIKEAHDKHRKSKFGKGTYHLIEDKIELLLKHQPYANVMMTITPETVLYYAESVEYLINIGFRYVIASLNYAGNWTDFHIKELQKQYKLLSKLYFKLTHEQKKFYFSPFEIKLASHIKEDDALCHRCILGKRQISIAPDGTIYPCVQFVQDGVSNHKYNIGHIRNGIDEEKREYFYSLSQKKHLACNDCVISNRCNNDCSCLNWQTTGMINEISPVLCETERILIPIVDKLGDKLYRNKEPMFVQKHYNSVYPILSLIDDIENKNINT